jgi:hypothetical protein
MVVHCLDLRIISGDLRCAGNQFGVGNLAYEQNNASIDMYLDPALAEPLISLFEIDSQASSQAVVVDHLTHGPAFSIGSDGFIGGAAKQAGAAAK